MYQEKKEENKAKYDKLKHKFAKSQLGDGPLGALRSPVSHELLEASVFERKIPKKKDHPN